MPFTHGPSTETRCIILTTVFTTHSKSINLKQHGPARMPLQWSTILVDAATSLLECCKNVTRISEDIQSHDPIHLCRTIAAGPDFKSLLTPRRTN